MTKVLLKRGHDVTVVEADPEAIAVQRQLGAEVIDADLDSDDWIRRLQGRKFDTILACDVLEHLRSPATVLEALLRHAAPDAQLIISVPNVAYAGLVAALRLGFFEYAETGLLDQTHVHFFSRRSLEKVLLAVGWTPTHWEACRVPIEESEFVWSWRELSQEQRQGLLAGWTEFDVYEWMAVATPSADGATWALNAAKADAAQARSELHELLVRHGHEHESLIEHQKAFGEARSIIARFEGELAEFKREGEIRASELASQRALLADKSNEVEKLNRELQQLRAETVVQRLKRALKNRLG